MFACTVGGAQKDPSALINFFLTWRFPISPPNITSEIEIFKFKCLSEW